MNEWMMTTIRLQIHSLQLWIKKTAPKYYCSYHSQIKDVTKNFT